VVNILPLVEVAAALPCTSNPQEHGIFNFIVDDEVEVEVVNILPLVEVAAALPCTSNPQEHGFFLNCFIRYLQWL
jgi:hypothetical protein